MNIIKRRAKWSINQFLYLFNLEISRKQPHVAATLKHGVGSYPIFLKYPVRPEPRYGYGLPPHPEIEALLASYRETYRKTLTSFKSYISFLQQIPDQASDTYTPYWENPWFTNLDAVALYSFIVQRNPKVYLEIGSGNSTKFVRRAIQDHHLQTQIISIDPEPRAEIDQLSDKIIRLPLEDVDYLNAFDPLDQETIVFFDGSHRCFMNSDVTVFFLEFLPRLPSGVLIHIHDVYWPSDYPPARKEHYESEQYLLAMMFLFGNDTFDIVLPNHYITHHQDLCSIFDDEVAVTLQDKFCSRGSSFWMQKK